MKLRSNYDKVKHKDLEMVVLDAGYKTPAIAKKLLDDAVKPLFPYKRPMTKEGFFPKREYVYDEMYDCYICPWNKVLEYSTMIDGKKVIQSWKLKQLFIICVWTKRKKQMR